MRSLVLAIIPIVFSTLCVGMANAKDASVNVVSCEYKVDGVGIKLTEKEGEMELKLEKDTSEFSRLISNKSADAMALLSEYLSVESYDELYRQQGSHSFSHITRDKSSFPVSKAKDGTDLSIKLNIDIQTNENEGIEILIYDNGEGALGQYVMQRTPYGVLKSANKEKLISCN